jgi:hypothetical protein
MMKEISLSHCLTVALSHNLRLTLCLTDDLEGLAAGR